MKSLGTASIAALLLLSFMAPRLATAQSSARGSYRFILEDDQIKSLDFDASTDGKGSTTGQMAFTDEAKIADVADPEDPRAGDPPPQLYIKATIEDMTVEKNRAVMNGTVRDSSHKTYIGKFVQLVVEDNGSNLDTPDHLTWTFCQPQRQDWVPSDAERDKDDGAYWSWWATDAERKDDVGIPSPSLLPKEDTSCPVRPLWSYAFANVRKWDGDIVVQP